MISCHSSLNYFLDEIINFFNKDTVGIKNSKIKLFKNFM